MFKSAASKIAHSTTIPSLGTNSDLRPLQDLITSEKTVIISLQKLSSDYGKAADAIKAWGVTEGEDLGHILSASTALLSHFSKALSQYAAHGHVIRDNLKAIRSREEALDDLRRRRRAVHRKADDAERKLSKMSSEHKHFESQKELLIRLKDEMRTMDSEIMTQEASLGDYKRACTRTWLGLKFGGLLECCKTGDAVAEYGKRLVSEIPEEHTQPGMPRSLYHGHSKVEAIMIEASRGIGQGPNAPRPEVPPQPPQPPQMPVPQHAPLNINTLPNLPFKVSMDSPASNAPHSTRGVDDFGVQGPPAISPLDSPNAGSARFATFPVNTRQDSYNLPNSVQRQAPLSLNTPHQIEGSSFSLEIAAALDAKEKAIAIAGDDAASSWRGRLSGEAILPPPVTSPPPPDSPAVVAQSPPINPQSPANPQFTSLIAQSPSVVAQSPSIAQSPGWASSPAKSPGIQEAFWEPPPLAARPEGQYLSAKKDDDNRSQISEDDNALLAYMTSADDYAPSSPDSAKPNLADSASAQAPSTVDTPPAALSPPTEPPISPISDDQSKPLPHPSSIKSMDVEIVHVDGRISMDTERKPVVHRVPPPSYEPEQQEQALNAAAARAINIDAVPDFKLPAVSYPKDDDVNSRNQNEPEARGRGETRESLDRTAAPNREPSPLEPPHAPFARRAVSPHPSFEGLSLRTPAQAYAHSYQQSSSQQASTTPTGSPRQIPTAAQAYAQSYQGNVVENQPSHPYPNPYADPPVPPRQDSTKMYIQSLQNLGDTGIPPRFQALRTQNSASMLRNDLPPRLQAQNHSQSYQPEIADLRYTGMNPSPQPSQQLPSTGYSSGDPTPYRTPGEYPSGSGPPQSSYVGLPPVNIATTQFETGGKISAAAFKRPQPLHRGAMDGGSTTPYGTSGYSPNSAPAAPQHHHQQSQQSLDHLRQRPPQEYQPYGNAHPNVHPTALHPAQSYAQQPHPPQPQFAQGQPRPVSRELPPPPGAGNARPISNASDDIYSHYDYISAYQASPQGSPHSADFGEKGPGPGGRTSVYAPGNQPQYQQQQQQQYQQHPGPLPPGYGGYGGQHQGQGQYLPPGAAPSQPSGGYSSSDLR